MDDIARTLPARPSDELETQACNVLANAVDAYESGLSIYKSLRNLNDVIGTEYGDRVLYELIQNAHDAHQGGITGGRIAIRLEIQSESEATLYLANGGNGFRDEDVEAIKNIATSAKQAGEGIGNKGLGFRSIEALTDDVHIYSCNADASSKRSFDGYCFRFATPAEIEEKLKSNGNDGQTAQAVAHTIPRYLVPVALDAQQPETIREYANKGYATVITAPLSRKESVELATEQVQNLADLNVPLLLFLDRIAEVGIEISRPEDKPYKRRLTRRQRKICDVPALPGTQLYEVKVGGRHDFLVVRSEVDKERVLEAVEASIPSVSQLKSWRNWKGTPVVSLAVGLSPKTVTTGRLYNFLPMGEGATCPFQGYLDAPFFAEIDRRNTNLSLPLNNVLMVAAAEACAASVMSILEEKIDVTQSALFDLFAWTGEHAELLDNTFDEMEQPLKDVMAIPAIAERGQRAWSSLSEVWLWPEGSFSVLTNKAAAKYVDAQIVSEHLDPARTERLHTMANRVALPLNPPGSEFADWAEQFAGSLHERKAAFRTWSRFYSDLVRLFDAAEENLDELDGKNIFYDKRGKLRPAGSSGGEKRVFVRNSEAKGARKKTGVPLPPSTLVRRFRFLHPDIDLQQGTFDAFVRAGLIEKYNPVAALAELKIALGQHANENRRREALEWAFKVWRSAESQSVEEELKAAGLFVPTRSGWRPAAEAAFSSSWTKTGTKLENYLVESADTSHDCHDAYERLLVPQQEWPISLQNEKKRWHRFLEIIGVVDGLTSVSVDLKSNCRWGNHWSWFFQSSDANKQMGFDWCAEVGLIQFAHPNTDYQVRGEIERLPGQNEHCELSDSAKEIFCDLVFEFLKEHGDRCLEFELGRFERSYSQRDTHAVPTPLATFLRSQPWVATTNRDGVSFLRPDQCWASGKRRGGAPRFISHLSERSADLSEDEKFAELVFSDAVGLRNWQDKNTAIERLQALATVAKGVQSGDRPALRKEYRQAWRDAIEIELPIPADISLVVTRLGRLEVVGGNSAEPEPIFVTDDAQNFAARAISGAGKAVLEVGSIDDDEIVSAQHVAGLLKASGGFAPRRVGGSDVQLLVDGERFAASAGDPLLTSFGLEWLPDVIVIGHEVRGEQLERGIRPKTVDTRSRMIRVRRCETITLLVDEKVVSSSENLTCYAFEDEKYPTLILTKNVPDPLNWSTLANQLSLDIARLIHKQLRSLELVLLRLANQNAGDLEAPSTRALANALNCDEQHIEELRAQLRTDLDHILHLLLPVVGYYCGVELVGQLQHDSGHAGAKFDIRTWLDRNLAIESHTTDELLSACEHAPNRSDLRNRLNLDYQTFNRTLMELGEEPLSNEEGLRQQFSGYLSRMRAGIIDRLRRFHFADFQAGRSLSTYVERKRLEYIVFNTDWILAKERLDQSEVKAYVTGRLVEVLGEDVDVTLPPYKQVTDGNRRTLRKFVEEARLAISLWCRQNSTVLPEPWRQQDSQSIVRDVENSGYLDFEKISPVEMPMVCQRADCWPEDMPRTIDFDILDLSRDDIEEEQRQREREQDQRKKKQRSVEFAGRTLDTGAPGFSDDMRELMEDALLQDASWLDRCRQQTRLNVFDTPSHRSGSSTAGKGTAGAKHAREKQLSEPQKQAMGLAGERLAFQYLQYHHGTDFNETCWVSTNRRNDFGGDPGDDSLGYDFCVKTHSCEWLYEVKSTLADSCEFELTANELSVAGSVSKDGRKRYRILYVPYVFSPDRWRVLTLPNPVGDNAQNRYKTVGRGSVRLRFERAGA